DGHMPLQEAHLIGHIAQDRLQDTLNVADVLVHVEPVQALNETTEL
ncbi:MAG: hypothetical protein KDJ65_38815, partial [Anaerolineae bacterium]|nr:hypothetical protein [Anaerolineae bacterium]